MSLSLHRFLNSSHSFLQKWLQSKNHILNVVIGNQAADADSIIGSLVYAYLLYSKCSDELQYYIPLVHIAREKLPLRNEVMRLFSLVGIDYKTILTVNDFQNVISRPSDRICFHLVDHNVLSPSLAVYEQCITDIIDHRKDEGLYPSANRLISYNPEEGKGVGSCCTLIGDLLRQWNLSQSMSECSLLLEGVVLLDTMNLSPSINKTTQQDRDIIAFLEQQHPQLSISQNTLFETLSSAKYDPGFWSAISLRDALEYDFKIFKMGSYQIGWSAVLTALHSFVSLNGFQKEIQTFCEEKRLDGLIFSSVIAGDRIRREFYLQLKDGVDRVEKTLMENYNCVMEKEHILYTYTPISRKALAPILMKLFE